VFGHVYWLDVAFGLILAAEYDNRYDQGAIKVMRLNGEQLGFIPAHVSRGGDSSGLACRMDRGDQYRCKISDLTGSSGKTLGVNIEITEIAEDEQYNTAETRPVTDTLSQVAVAPASENQAWLWVLGAVAVVIATLVIALELCVEETTGLGANPRWPD
jgi:hypothetical protein